MYLIVKTAFDYILSFILLVILVPLFIIVSLFIKIDSKGPVFFTQKRLGKHGKKFNLLKFRTMYNEKRSALKEILPGDKEVTIVGNQLRRYKIDEIPQLINILKGEMSIIGPRPCLPLLLDEFDDNAIFRLKVKPGLTGLAQINGNIHITWPERWKLDRYYVENLSLSLDLKILITTVAVVILGEEKFIKNSK